MTAEGVTQSRPLVSVVFSFRNEQGNIPVLIGRLEAMFAAEPVDYELIFVNDASTDRSLPELLAERARNPRIKVITMSRRFGVAECFRAGMAAASGNAVVYMDTDLQDPPEVIPRLLEKWRAGADIVHTVRTHRHGESAVKMFLTRIGYRIIQYGSTIELPVNAGDFKLLSRAALAHLLALRESDPYLRGLVVWLGFTQAFVPYEREARHAGRTHFPFFSRNPWKTFVMGVTSASFMPIYACLAAAAAGAVVTIFVTATALVFMTTGSSLAATTALVALLTFFWTTTMAGFAAVGLYIIRIYKDVRQRPQYIVASTAGLPAPSSMAVENHREHAER
jgi:glycosyltransferase involved in cell wall biosynthesis